MLIAAVSDLDSLGGDFREFARAVDSAKKPDLLLFAGDICDINKARQYKEILAILDKAGWDCPIFGVFGNREIEEEFDTIRRITAGRVTWLEDEMVAKKIKGKTVEIIGTRGCLDRPTWWQATNFPGIDNMYKDRFDRIVEMIRYPSKADLKILVSHYGLSYKTLKGENPEIYAGLGCSALEPVIAKSKLKFAVHGHAHFGTAQALAGRVPIFNVAFPVNKGIVLIDTDKMPKKGLNKFL